MADSAFSLGHQFGKWVSKVEDFSLLFDGEGLGKDGKSQRGRGIASSARINTVVPSPPFTRTRDPGVEWWAKIAFLLEEFDRATSRPEGRDDF
eukprot:6330584-Pyramimonas_sp.AAC.1